MKNQLNTENFCLEPLSTIETLDTNGGAVGPWTFLGPVGAAVGIIGGVVGLYEWGYQYAKRKMEQNWK